MAAKNTIISWLMNFKIPVFLKGAVTNNSNKNDVNAITPLYYINTNEIPGELSPENLISSHVKRTCSVHT